MMFESGISSPLNSMYGICLTVGWKWTVCTLSYRILLSLSQVSSFSVNSDMVCIWGETGYWTKWTMSGFHNGRWSSLLPLICWKHRGDNRWRIALALGRIMLSFTGTLTLWFVLYSLFFYSLSTVVWLQLKTISVS